jgi:hypothetical protein
VGRHRLPGANGMTPVKPAPLPAEEESVGTIAEGKPLDTSPRPRGGALEATGRRPKKSFSTSMPRTTRCTAIADSRRHAGASGASSRLQPQAGCVSASSGGVVIGCDLAIGGRSLRPSGPPS